RTNREVGASIERATRYVRRARLTSTCTYTGTQRDRENSQPRTGGVRWSAMAWFVYVVRCGDGSLYTGISNDVEARVAVHNEGRGARYTRSRRPVTLLYVERRRSRSTAQRREAAIKALPRVQKWALVKIGRAHV